ncbi:hypothetical protein L210DRAFT_962178 [Boletus edulis BED1]|uniref:tRNA-splicing endonuclease subunit Sen15 domain-containing protein n=1 Tax=Boletus edulis BED1 TaxID=1328754 RepID=A0AAD4BFX0_BOLED|nr:hypothetical protein L210DRAFT_962178 [Boletus edulis BED1]
MQSHPSHPRLARLISKCQKSASALFQKLNDVTLDIQVLELPQRGRGGRHSHPFPQTAGEPSSTCVAVPCGLAESISTPWIRDAFAALDTQLADAPETLFAAICSRDSSIVCYKISKGIIRPQV